MRRRSSLTRRVPGSPPAEGSASPPTGVEASVRRTTRTGSCAGAANHEVDALSGRDRVRVVSSSAARRRRKSIASSTVVSSKSIRGMTMRRSFSVMYATPTIRYQRRKSSRSMSGASAGTASSHADPPASELGAGVVVSGAIVIGFGRSNPLEPTAGGGVVRIDAEHIFVFAAWHRHTCQG